MTYIPLKVIPKVFRPAFKNKVAPKVKAVPNNATHVITVNDKHFVPITNVTVKPVVVGNTTYVPVYVANASKLDVLKPIAPKTTEKVDTFKIGNVTYIPKSIIPKVFQPLFKTKSPTKTIADVIAPIFKNTTVP